MKWPGFEFYAGDAERIAAAASADQWDKLHSGGITPYVALFFDASASQVDLIEETVSVVSHNPPVRFLRHGKVLVDVNDDGLSVGTAPIDWITSLANLNDEQSRMLAPALRIAYQAVYVDPPDESFVKAMQKPMEDLVWVCRQAKSLKLDVVEVFLADW